MDKTWHADCKQAYERSEDPIYVLENNIPIDSNYYLENQISKVCVSIFPVFSICCYLWNT